MNGIDLSISFKIHHNNVDEDYRFFLSKGVNSVDDFKLIQ